MRSRTLLINGPAGVIETLVDSPVKPRGIALVAHPHPLGGGANTNKVVHTLARILVHLGYIAFRPNFRGVGRSEGAHDDGEGESADLLAVLADVRRHHDPGGGRPVVLSGFSFGAYCQTRVAQHLESIGKPAKRMLLVGLAVGEVSEGDRYYDTAPVSANSIIIHGGRDNIVPLTNVLDWAEPHDLPVTVIPGADHFFHRRLHILREVICRAWCE